MSTFYDNFISLCSRDHVAPTYVAKRIGLTGASATGWLKGKLPRYSTQNRIADYFNVTVDQLMGRAPLSSDLSGESQGLSSESVFIYKHTDSGREEAKEKPTSKGELDQKSAIMSLLDGMTEAELMLVLERIKKIRNSR